MSKEKVSTKELARIIDVKTIAPCNPDTANRHSGYVVGGISPFGTRKKMPVYMEESILELLKIYINGGRRGYLVGIAPQEAVRILSPKLVKAGISERASAIFTARRRGTEEAQRSTN